ncbi:hypothetical protein C2S51_033443 [Perilla frutescens var. frutescens]|nr:hypothetical protein C2S51_033443 [Perilla frutescens var. frutescens]
MEPESQSPANLQYCWRPSASVTPTSLLYVLSCIPEDTMLTIMCDSCNSGNLIGFKFDQIEPQQQQVFPLNEREIRRGALVGDEGILLVDEFSNDNENGGYGEFTNAFVLGVINKPMMSSMRVGEVVRNYLRMRDVGRPCRNYDHQDECYGLEQLT